MDIKKRLLAIAEKLSGFEKELADESVTEERISQINAETDTLIRERHQLNFQLKTEQANDLAGGSEVETTTSEKQRVAKEELEKRARELMQGRAITLDDVDLLHSTEQGNNLTPTFNQVSSLTEMIGIKPLIGVESFSKGYMKGYGMAGYTAEGVAATDSEPEWAYADMKKVKLTAYTEVPEEFEKLAPEMYLKEIQNNLRISMFRKLALEVLLGDGGTGHITGINSASAIVGATDLEIDAIDENTLDQIIFSYGGEEDVSVGVLILSKGALRAFNNVRGTQDKKKVYTIDTVKKTIDGHPYVINSGYKDPASAAAGEIYMAYGTLDAYQINAHSAMTLQKSSDYKFKEGQVAYKSSGMFSGNVVKFNGFIRIKKTVV